MKSLIVLILAAVMVISFPLMIWGFIFSFKVGFWAFVAFAVSFGVGIPLGSPDDEGDSIIDHGRNLG